MNDTKLFLTNDQLRTGALPKSDFPKSRVSANSSSALTIRLKTGQLTWVGPLFMLGARVLLFGLFQALVAGIFLLQGSARAWQNSVAWWPIAATLTNLVCLAFLRHFLSREGLQLRHLYPFELTYLKQDSWLILGLLLLIIPVVLLPNYFLATQLFGNANTTFDMMFQPLPLWANWLALLAFPVTIAFAELPTYFSYVMPRLKVLSGSTFLGILLPVLLLSFQHATLPLIFDWRFVVWRLFMFLGFSLLLGLSLNWRPRLLPYFMLVHGLLDLATAFLVFSLAT
jgi:hypothetical protein